MVKKSGESGEIEKWGKFLSKVEKFIYMISSMEDTGITYKTCADSRRSYAIVDWHAANQAAQQSNKIITRICSICTIYRICKILPDLL
jgi:hypothetical protein